jgi:hypothetical protein
MEWLDECAVQVYIYCCTILASLLNLKLSLAKLPILATSDWLLVQ